MSDKIRVTCTNPDCGERLSVGSHLVGKKVRCPSCSRVVTVPGTAAGPAAGSGRDQMITPDNLSKELLKSILDAAFIDAEYDEDGDIRAKGGDCRCWVLPNDKHKDRIRLMTFFAFKPHASRTERLDCANKINKEYVCIRASISDKGTLFFDYDILVEGGITAKAFVLTVKRFCSIPHTAVAEHGTGIVE